MLRTSSAILKQQSQFTANKVTSHPKNVQNGCHRPRAHADVLQQRLRGRCGNCGQRLAKGCRGGDRQDC